MQAGFRINSQNENFRLNNYINNQNKIKTDSYNNALAFYGYSEKEVFANTEMGGMFSRLKKRFYLSEVSPGKLYRGAKPKEKHLSELEKLHIKTIVCLKPLKDGKLEKYKSMVEANNFKFEYLPIDQAKGPKKKDIDRFLEIMNNNNNHPVFVHCHYGFDRTGLLVGMYRIANDNYSFDQAYSEMKNFGYSKKLYPEYKNMLKEFWENNKKKLSFLV